MTQPPQFISQDTVAEMQRRVLAEISARADSAAASQPEKAAALAAYLLAARRKRLRVSETALAELTARDTNTIAAATLDLQKDLFEPAQRARLDAAAAARKDPAVVTAIFGDASRLYLRPLHDHSTAIEQRVAAFLTGRGLQLSDYNAGHATDGKQKYKIGRLLTAAGETELLADFEADERRSLERLMVVISRDPEDIARMSAGRGWFSCMLPHKPEFTFIPGEIEFGTLAAYLVRDTDPGIDNPLARLVIRPYRKVEPEIEAYKALDTEYNRLRQPLKRKLEKLKVEARWALHGRPPGENDVLYIAERKAYGLSRGILQHTAEVFTRQHLNPGLSAGDYHLPWQVYTDTLDRDARIRDGRIELVPTPRLWE